VGGGREGGKLKGGLFFRRFSFGFCCLFFFFFSGAWSETLGGVFFCGSFEPPPTPHPVFDPRGGPFPGTKGGVRSFCCSSPVSISFFCLGVFALKRQTGGTYPVKNRSGEWVLGILYSPQNFKQPLPFSTIYLWVFPIY